MLNKIHLKRRALNHSASIGRRLSALFLAMIFALTSATNGFAAPSSSSSDIVTRLGRGMNVLGYDPIWQDPAKTHFKPTYYRMLRESGFQNIRVNLHAFSHMDESDRLDPRWLATLDDVVRRATEAGLVVIIDEHDYRACAQNAQTCRVKLLAFWDQIALHYRNAPRSVLFELLNEPNGAITPEIWNGLLLDVLSVVRKTNPTRAVVIGPTNFYNFRSLDKLSLPEDDRNIIVTVHYYHPNAFTFQGAAFTTPSRENLVGVKWGSDADREAITADFSVIATWSREHDRPILLGEFGTYDKGDMASRVAWTSTVARTAEHNHFAWSYWQFEDNFSAYDASSDGWIAPIHSALVPDPARHRE